MNKYFSKITTILILLALGVIIVLIIGLKSTNKTINTNVQDAQNENKREDMESPVKQTSVSTTLAIPLIIEDAKPVGEAGGAFGCGSLVYWIDYEVPKTSGVLKATYEALFSISNADVLEGEWGPYNYISRDEDLYFNSVAIDEGIAKVNLSGSISAYGCSIPAFRAQMEQAALQFDTVKKVMFYLNGEIYDWCEKDQSDGEGSCPENPQYWIVEK